MNYIIWAAARSPHVAALIIWVLIQLYFVDGRELLLVCTAIDVATRHPLPAPAVVVDHKQHDPTGNEEGDHLIGDNESDGQDQDG
jgi:hypothetical protein